MQEPEQEAQTVSNDASSDVQGPGPFLRYRSVSDSHRDSDLVKAWGPVSGHFSSTAARAGVGRSGTAAPLAAPVTAAPPLTTVRDAR